MAASRDECGNAAAAAEPAVKRFAADMEPPTEFEHFALLPPELQGEIAKFAHPLARRALAQTCKKTRKSTRKRFVRVSEIAQPPGFRERVRALVGKEVEVVREKFVMQQVVMFGWDPMCTNIYPDDGPYCDIDWTLFEFGLEVLRWRGRAALPSITAYSGPKYDRVIETLARAGVDLEAPDFRGNTELMRALCETRAYGDHPTTAKPRTLINVGVDVNARNNEGRTALMIAVDASWTVSKLVEMIGDECAHQLLDAGADMAARDSLGSTALMVAVASGRCVIARDLSNRDRGMQVRERDIWKTLASGMSMLHDANRENP